MYMYIHSGRCSPRSNWLKIDDFGGESPQSRAKTHVLKAAVLSLFWGAQRTQRVLKALSDQLAQYWGGVHQIHLPLLIWTHHLAMASGSMAKTRRGDSQLYA